MVIIHSKAIVKSDSKGYNVVSSSYIYTCEKRKVT